MKFINHPCPNCGQLNELGIVIGEPARLTGRPDSMHDAGESYVDSGDECGLCGHELTREEAGKAIEAAIKLVGSQT